MRIAFVTEQVETQTETKRPSRAPLLLGGVVGLLVVLAAAFFLLIAPQPAPTTSNDDAAPEPTQLLNNVIAVLRDLQTFSLLLEQEGVAFPFTISLDQGESTVEAVMRRGEAQYIAPNNMYGDIRLNIANLPAIGVELFAQGQDQWFRLFNSRWLNWPIAEGFDPGTLVQEDSGFPAALNQLTDVTYVALDSLPDGRQAHHVQGVATGAVISELLFNLLDFGPEVSIIADVYILPENNYPVLLFITLPGSGTETEADTRWRVELFDFDQAPTANIPPGIELPDVSTNIS